MKERVRLGINIDHVATLRNARGEVHPDPVRAAHIAKDAGADGITAHLREDRRHIRDKDMERLKAEIDLPLNFEMAATEEMLKIAQRIKPNACCIVPERRQEITTEGGLNVVSNMDELRKFTKNLQQSGIKVSLFLSADKTQIDAAKLIGADIVEIHTGAYCLAKGDNQKKELQKIIKAAEYLQILGIECHAGHGLSYDTVGPIAKISNMRELNIGHFIIGEAIFCGISESIRKMREIIDA